MPEREPECFREMRLAIDDDRETEREWYEERPGAEEFPRRRRERVRTLRPGEPAPDGVYL